MLTFSGMHFLLHQCLCTSLEYIAGFPDGSVNKESACNAGDLGSIPGLGRSPGGEPTPVFLPGESHGQRSLAGYSLWGHKESGTTERLRLDVFFLPLATQLVSD